MKTATIKSYNRLNEPCADCKVKPNSQHKPTCKGGNHSLELSEKAERQQWTDRRRANHHRALESLAQQVNCSTDGLKLWRQLRRVENWTDHHSLKHCNGEIDGEQWEAIKEQAQTRLTQIFGGRIPEGVFINSDPRGYALKLDNEKVTIPEGMDKDWGGYGILAAEID